jgi:tetratricopeptide (TPR) repeat protein
VKRTLFLLIWLLVGAVAFQGFECASRNVTTAKVKIKNQQFDEAIESLNKELAINPNSDEALALLADIYFQRKNMSEAAKYSKKALEVTKNPLLVEQMQRLINNIWVYSYNTGIENYNGYLSKQNKQLLDSAINNFKMGADLRPEILDFYNFLGIVYELKGDKQASLESYESFVKGYDKNYQFAMKNGMYSKVPRAKVIDKLGNPKLPMPGLNGKGDSTFKDYYVIDGKELYVFSENIDGKMLVTGWNYDMPSTWLPNEKLIKVDVNTAPLAVLAQNYYTNKDYDKSLKYVKMIVELEPDNSSVYASMVNIYQELNRTDEAIETVKALIKSDPKNPMFITQLADLYQTLQKYDDAINTYQQALSANPDFDRAIRNLAAAHKNRASVKQRAEQDKQDKDKAYKIDMEKYMPDLRESAKYFAKALDTKTFKNDVLVLTELANIYQVLEEKENLKKTVRNLEAIELLIPENQRQAYYLSMVRIYSEMGDTKKLEEIQKKMK